MTFNPGDGIGIHETGPAGWEYDEIEWNEVFAVKFKKDGNPVSYYLDEIYLTDLFTEHNYVEQGKYKLFLDSGWSGWTPFAADSDQLLGSTNGVLSLLIGVVCLSISSGREILSGSGMGFVSPNLSLTRGEFRC